MSKSRQKLFYSGVSFLILLAILLFFILTPMAKMAGNYLVRDDGAIVSSDAVVLAGHFPTRFLEAFDQFKNGKVKRILFTKANRIEHLDKIENLGVKIPTYYEISREVLIANGFNSEKVFFAEGIVKSTRDEAIIIGKFMREHEIKKMTIITSKSSARRQCWIIEKMNPDLAFSCKPSRYDIFSPDGWWKSRRDVMLIFNEYLKLIGYKIEFIFDKKVFK